MNECQSHTYCSRVCIQSNHSNRAAKTEQPCNNGAGAGERNQVTKHPTRIRIHILHLVYIAAADRAKGGAV